jgi:hypothetical protein
VTERSVQHGRRIDDAMESELEGMVRGSPVEPRAREDLELEPTESAVVRPDLEGDAEHGEVLERSELARFLRPSAFPGDVDTLVAVAVEEHAPDELLGQLEQLSRSTVYTTVGEVWAALGHEAEHREQDTTVATGPAPPAPEAVAVPARPVDDAPEASDREPAPNPIERVAHLGIGLVRTAVRLPFEVLSSVRRLVSR